MNLLFRKSDSNWKWLNISLFHYKCIMSGLF